MHIEFKRVVLHNFFSFGDTTLTFEDEGFIRVSGINDNPTDNARSNGSGKSSLWEGIVWAITGETIRGTKQIVNIHGQDGCFVELEFYIDTNCYRIIRSKDHTVFKTSLQIYVDGVDISGKGIRDSEKILQQHLPNLTTSLLGSVIILGQGLPQKFTNNSPSGRKEVLEQLSKSDFMIEDLKTRVSSRKSELSSEQRTVDNLLIQSSTQKSVLEEQISQSQSLLESLDAEKLKQQLKELQEIETAASDRIVELNTNIETLSDELTTNLSTESSITLSETEELRAEQRVYEETTSPYVNSLHEVRAQLEVYKAELKRIQSIKDICPTCGQKLSDVHKPDTSDLEKNIETLSVELNKLDSFMLSYDTEYDSVTKRIREKYTALKSNISIRCSQITADLKHYRMSLKQAEEEQVKARTKISEIEKSITQLESTIEFNKKIIDDNQAKILVIQDELMYNNMQKDLIQSRLEVVNKFDTALKRDFRGYLLYNVIRYIEQRAKYYCNMIFNTTELSFCLDGNNIDIEYMNKPYENLSGGEKQKVDLIIQFSIRDMLSSQLNFTSNILVLDEVFDGLDTIGCNRVIDMISSLSDVNNVFIVTHRKDLSLPSDKELVIVKSSAGISEIQ